MLSPLRASGTVDNLQPWCSEGQAGSVQWESEAGGQGLAPGISAGAFPTWGPNLVLHSSGMRGLSPKVSGLQPPCHPARLLPVLNSFPPSGSWGQGKQMPKTPLGLGVWGLSDHPALPATLSLRTWGSKSPH